jgi:hypothetical protein
MDKASPAPAPSPGPASTSNDVEEGSGYIGAADVAGKRITLIYFPAGGRNRKERAAQ